MKYTVSLVIIFFLLISCKKNDSENIIVNFSYRDAFDSNYLKRNENKRAELIISKKTNKGILVTVDKYVTGGIKYYGNAKVINDFLYLFYTFFIGLIWIHMTYRPFSFQKNLISNTRC